MTERSWEMTLAETVFKQGYEAAQAGMALKNNPYVDYVLYETYRVEFYDYWRDGWLASRATSEGEL